MSNEIVTNPAPQFYCDFCEMPLEKMHKIIAKSDNSRWLILCKDDLLNVANQVID